MLVNSKNACKMKFTDHLWLVFIDQPQSYVVACEIIYFDIYKYIVTEWKNGIFINEIVKFNETLEDLSTEVLELKN